MRRVEHACAPPDTSIRQKRNGFKGFVVAMFAYEQISNLPKSELLESWRRIGAVPLRIDK